MNIIEPEYAWMDGELVKWSDAKVPILTHALHYGTAVFEGIRAYPSKNNLYVFRLRDHMQRLLDSAKIYYLDTKYGVEELMNAAVELLKSNKMKEMTYIRPIIYVGYGGIGLNFTGFPIKTALCTIAFGKYFDKSAIRVCTSSWRRISEISTPPMSKAGGNYLNSVLAKFEALKNGYDDAVLLDSQGLVSEGTGENIFVVNDGKLTTPPLSSSILRGITRDTVMKVAGDSGIDVQERQITRAQLYLCDEVFFSGTAAEITPVIEVDRRMINGGRPGNITILIRKMYTDIVEGRNSKYMHWLTPVY